jgi:hypothetical protein
MGSGAGWDGFFQKERVVPKNHPGRKEEVMKFALLCGFSKLCAKTVKK